MRATISGGSVDGRPSRTRPIPQNRRIHIPLHHRHGHRYLHEGDSGMRTTRRCRDGSMCRMGIPSSSIAHVRLTVTDIERSRQFYESVFGWPVLLEVPENADEKTRDRFGFLFGGVIYDLGGTLLGLRPVATDRFDENRAGLDHIAFRLANKAELDSAAAHLDEIGVQHEPIKDIGPSYILEFRDPDNIALELSAPK
jgi:glyoxylase I family protein